MTKSQKVIEWLSKKFDKIRHEGSALWVRHDAGDRIFCDAFI